MSFRLPIHRHHFLPARKEPSFSEKCEKCENFSRAIQLRKLYCITIAWLIKEVEEHCITFSFQTWLHNNNKILFNYIRIIFPFVDDPQLQIFLQGRIWDKIDRFAFLTASWSSWWIFVAWHTFAFRTPPHRPSWILNLSRGERGSLVARRECSHVIVEGESSNLENCSSAPSPTERIIYAPRNW